MQIPGFRKLRTLWQELKHKWSSHPAAETAPAAAPEQPPQLPVVAGTEPGWLRVLDAGQLLQCVQATKAVAEIFRQSRQSQETWARDLLPAIHRYAEFVQLMPASEAHHHAHAGGLLSHTIEMLLAAITWRNAHLLPEGSAIEEIDATRDQWTYVVFFAALLHDIAKPMTDLRIQWRADGMADSVRWAPAGGSLVQIMQGQAGEYLVGFAPKSQRDYSAHTRLAQTLLPRIAPPSALTFLAREPLALDVLEKYLCGQDKESLVAQIVKRADRASTQRALLSGSKARFASASAVALIDLMMQAMTSMLRNGSALPLNRNGAAGWVYEGAIWFVAKRLADSVRDWIKANEPDEAVPGQTKNDRLFDTWQEYGVIDLNPATGQAIWYVEIHGEQEQGAYVHEFAMLRFPLAKVFSQESQYPAAMRGHLVLKDKRKADSADEQELAPALTVPSNSATALPNTATADTAISTELQAAPDLVDNTAQAAPISSPVPAPPKPPADSKMAAIMRAPTFSRPPAAPAPATSKKPQAAPASKKPQTAANVSAAKHQKPAPIHNNRHEAGDDAYLLDEDSPFLDMQESAHVVKSTAKPTTIKLAAKQPLVTQPTVKPAEAGAISAGATKGKKAEERQGAAGEHSPGSSPQTAAIPATAAAALPAIPAQRRVSQEFRDLLEDVPAILPRTAVVRQPEQAAATPQPVLLVQQLPELPGTPTDKPAHTPSELAQDFMQWVQQGLVRREIKYNEAGATVHFVPEGMALVSPRIFRDYAAQVEGEDQAQELGARVQREVIKCGWHLPAPNRTNIIRYAIQGRGGTVVGYLSCVVLVQAGLWVQPVPPANPALTMVSPEK